MTKTISLHHAWTGEADCRQCILRASVLFAELEQADFERIHQPIDQFDCSAGEPLYRAGDTGSHVITIREGLVKLVQYLPDGTHRIVRLARSTDVIGLETLLEQHYQHDAVPLQPTAVCRIPAEIVRELAWNSPRVHRELMLRWHHALSEADAWLTELSTGSARRRIARLLIRLTDERPLPCHTLFGREDMGAMLGITTETTSRVIAEFKRAGLIREDPGGTGCVVCDRTALEHIAAE